MSYGLGLDLGSTFTAAATVRGESPRTVEIGPAGGLMPSLVRSLVDGRLLAGSVHSEASDRPQARGHEFRRRIGDSIPMLIGERRYTAADLLVALMSAAIDKVAEVEGGPPDHIVVTHPAAWGPHRREQLTEVARRAGLPRQSIVLLSEAEAVAVHHLANHPLPGPGPLAVYDAGGGTFDATVIRAPGTGPTGRGGQPGTGVLGVPESLEWLGGVDVDDEVVRYLDDAADGMVSLLDARRPGEAGMLETIREACVRAKEALSVAAEVVIDAPAPQSAERRKLSRDQVEEWVRPRLVTGLPTLRRTLDSAAVHAAELSTVLLTGGTARMPLVPRMLEADLGRPVLLVESPQHSVALGAALVAGQAGRAGPRSSPAQCRSHIDQIKS